MPEPVQKGKIAAGPDQTQRVSFRTEPRIKIGSADFQHLPIRSEGAVVFALCLSVMLYGTG